MNSRRVTTRGTKPERCVGSRQASDYDRWCVANMNPILATLWYPSPNPVSVFSVSVLIGCLVVAKLLALPSLRYSFYRQCVAGFLALLVLLMGVLLLGGRLPWTDQLAAGVTFLAFSFGFGVSAVRGPGRRVSVLAYLLNAVSLYVTSVFFLTSLDTVLSEYRPTRYLDVYAAPLIFGIPSALWLLASIKLFPKLTLPNRAQARMTTGQCPACAYDLRGTAPGSSCPECGAAIDWDRVVIRERK